MGKMPMPRLKPVATVPVRLCLKSKAQFAFAPATTADVEVIAQCLVAMAWETERQKLDLATVRLGVAGVFEDPSRGQYWLAECEGQVAGGVLTIPESVRLAQRHNIVDRHRVHPSRISPPRCFCLAVLPPENDGAGR